MKLLELKAKVYDLVQERSALVQQAQAIDVEIERISAQIAERENEKANNSATTADEL